MVSSALAASGIFTVMTLANPPAGTPGTTYGILAVNNGNLGVSTTTPATKLDVNGSTTIRGWLDMSGNIIMNVATPATSTDAVNKAYVDAPTKVWGQGRPFATVRNSSGTAVAGTSADAGECPIPTRGMRISRSSAGTTWGAAGAACPNNWWVCSGTERGAENCTTAYNPFILFCDPLGASGNELTSGVVDTTPSGWTADVATTPGEGAAKTRTGSFTTRWACTSMPAWCCTNY